MTLPASDDLIGLASLSLLPTGWMQHIAEQLRAGEPVSLLVERLGAERWPGDPKALARLRARGRAAIERALTQGIEAICWHDRTFPPALTAIPDPPPLLWAKGQIDALLAQPAVGIVGARLASPYGLAVAERLAADLAARGVTIVSGLARGVDSAAHRGVLAASGVTVAVFGSGVDVIYPAEHEPLAHEIQQRGAIVSEFVPGTPPNPALFPRRNRIISGLSRAIVVIEAGERSGSLITARLALEQGREVLAVPGNVLTGRNRGAHGLLRDGAKIVESADDILEELNLGSRQAEAVAPFFSSAVDPVLDALTAGEASDLDEIAERTGQSPARLLARLFELEVNGLVGRAGGGRFVRIDRSC